MKSKWRQVAMDAKMPRKGIEGRDR